MLRRLHIRDFLLIEELDLVLDEGLTIITGETGSGKSILVGALGLAMGGRADAGVLRDPARRCVIELEVDVEGLDLAPWFVEQGLPQESPAILRRQIDPGGRSRAFINDTPVRLEQLRELAERLVHVHSQHHTLLLNDPRFQLGLVDHYAGRRAEASAYTKIHQAWRVADQHLRTLREEEARSRAELDLIEHELAELEQARIKADEQEPLETALARADNAGDLIEALNGLDEGLSGDQGVLSTLARLKQMLLRPARVDDGVKALFTRLESVVIELKDIAAESASQANTVSLDPAEAERLRERLDLLLRLQQKYRVKDNAALIALRDELSAKAVGIGSLGDRITELEHEEAAMRERVMQHATELSKARAAAIGPLGERTTALLHDLGMPQAVLIFQHATTPEPSPQGFDRIAARFSAHADRLPVPLEKAASGGELSRVMLALISLSADARDLPTVLFDEIDTGVSGEVADRVGDLLARMAQGRQVVAITHLPQIASKARQHLLVSKHGHAGGTRTAIDSLDHERRVEAIARMLSGRKLTKQALENARVLLKGR